MTDEFVKAVQQIRAPGLLEIISMIGEMEGGGFCLFCFCFSE